MQRAAIYNDRVKCTNTRREHRRLDQRGTLVTVERHGNAYTGSQRNSTARSAAKEAAIDRICKILLADAFRVKKRREAAGRLKVTRW